LFIVLVFGPASQPKKPGFCGFSRWESSILEKTRFLTPRETKETGFLRVFSPVTSILEKTRFLTPPETKETGFLRFFSPVTSILEKTRFLTGRYNLRNRVFAVFFAGNEYSRKNPVSGPALISQ